MLLRVFVCVAVLGVVFGACWCMFVSIFLFVCVRACWCVSVCVSVPVCAGVYRLGVGVCLFVFASVYVR